MVAIDGFDVDDVLKLKSVLDCDGGGADAVVVVAPNKFTELVGFKPPPNPNEAPPLEPNKFDVGAAAALLGAAVDPPKLNAD